MSVLDIPGARLYYEDAQHSPGVPGGLRAWLVALTREDSTC
jgi:hypothetical protein